MKQMAIFNYYDDTQDLEEEVNQWIKDVNANVIDIDVRSCVSSFDNRICKLDKVEETRNNLVWYAVVTYEKGE